MRIFQRGRARVAPPLGLDPPRPPPRLRGLLAFLLATARVPLYLRGRRGLWAPDRASRFVNVVGGPCRKGLKPKALRPLPVSLLGA